MSFLSRITDLILLSLVLISKEILFAGEERLIVISYVFLFVTMYFFMFATISSDFEYRTNIIKEELDSLFVSIINTIVLTKKFILNSNFIYFRLIKLYKALLLEYYYNIYYHFNLSQFKLLFLNFKISQMLVSSLKFVTKLNFSFKNYYILSLYKYNIGWLSSKKVLWNRTICDLSFKGNFGTTASSNLENDRKISEKNRPWFITMEDWFSLNNNFKYKYLFEFKDFKYSIYNSYN